LCGKLELSTIGQVHDSSYYLKDTQITVHLSEFKDEESGIDHFEIGVGTQPFFTDILPAGVFYQSDIIIHIPDHDIKDGHTYYIASKVNI
jgi:hypothetical protein